jgi:hypothetical protein
MMEKHSIYEIYQRTGRLLHQQLFWEDVISPIFLYHTRTISSCRIAPTISFNKIWTTGDGHSNISVMMWCLNPTLNTINCFKSMVDRGRDRHHHNTKSPWLLTSPEKQDICSYITSYQYPCRNITTAKQSTFWWWFWYYMLP